MIERAEGMRASAEDEGEEGWRAWDSTAERFVQLYGDARAVREARQRIEPPDSISLIGSLFVDELNAIWVKRNDATSDQQDAWDVFSSLGIYLGEILLPVSLQPLEIGERHILGLVRDENDVEYVHLLRLDRRG